MSTILDLLFQQFLFNSVDHEMGNSSSAYMLLLLTNIRTIVYNLIHPQASPPEPKDWKDTPMYSAKKTEVN